MHRSVICTEDLSRSFAIRATTDNILSKSNLGIGASPWSIVTTGIEDCQVMCNSSMGCSSRCNTASNRSFQIATIGAKISSFAPLADGSRVKNLHWTRMVVGNACHNVVEQDFFGSTASPRSRRSVVWWICGKPKVHRRSGHNIWGRNIASLATRLFCCFDTLLASAGRSLVWIFHDKKARKEKGNRLASLFIVLALPHFVCCP